jgi:hypothetical protein
MRIHLNLNGKKKQDAALKSAALHLSPGAAPGPTSYRYLIDSHVIIHLVYGDPMRSRLASRRASWDAAAPCPPRRIHRETGLGAPKRNRGEGGSNSTRYKATIRPRIAVLREQRDRRISLCDSNKPARRNPAVGGSNSTRYKVETEFAVTHTKQTIGLHSTRYKSACVKSFKIESKAKMPR